MSLAGHRPAVRTSLAIRHLPYRPSAWFCAGWEFVGADDRAALARTLETSIASSQDPAERACLQAGSALMRGDARAAVALASKAIMRRAELPAAHVILGRALRAQGLHSRALGEFKRAAQLVPDDAQTLVEQAQEHVALDETVEARDCFYLALAHAPEHAAALLGLARVLRGLGDPRTALEHARHAAVVSPLNAQIQFESAQLLAWCDDVTGAATAYERGLALAPDNVAAHTNVGLLYLSRLGDARNARRHFERAVAIDPVCVAAQANLGLALEEGDMAAALSHYEKLIASQPAVNEYRWNRGRALLANGEYRRGWPDYEIRNALGRGPAAREFPYPVWSGEPLPDGAALLVYGEQGLGDEIMFSSCVPDLLARQINCVIECDSRLATLFARSFSRVQVHGAARDSDRSWLAAHPRIKAQCAIGSLPRMLRRTRAEFPSHSGYLAADPQRVAHWKKRIKEDTDGRHVGLAWRGGTRGTRGELRSIPLGDLAPILTTARLTFINLQRGGGESLTKIAAANGARIINFSEALDDVEEMAALCQALDEVITVDNSVAHLAGALGCRTSILLPHSADWRWLRHQATSPWYPSLTLYRQASPGDWASAVGQLRSVLAP